MRLQLAYSRCAIPCWWVVVVLLGGVILLGGCGAGPPVEEFPQPEDGAAEGVGFWPEKLDSALFGSGQRDSAQGDDANLWASLVERARQAVSEDRLEDAAELLDSAIRSAPPGRVWIPRRALGDVRLALREDSEAVRLYLEVSSDANAQGLAQLQGNLAVAYRRLEDPARARVAAERGLSLQPGYPEALRTLGLLDLEEGNREAGMSLLLEATGYGRVIPEAEVALAELEEEGGDLRNALARYRRLLETYESVRARDHHRRWRDLFYPSARGTTAELKARRDRLEDILTERSAPERDARNSSPSKGG